jgi:integration host factor subunit alpha
MSLTKRDVINNISLDNKISKSESTLLFDKFINLIVSNSKKSIVKIPNFGSFKFKSSPGRIGRNPLTKEEFVISERLKLNFKASNRLKNIIN